MNTDIDRIEKGDLLFPLWVISSVLHEFLGYFIPPLHWHLTKYKETCTKFKNTQTHSRKSSHGWSFEINQMCLWTHFFFVLFDFCGSESFKICMWSVSKLLCNWHLHNFSNWPRKMYIHLFHSYWKQITSFKRIVSGKVLHRLTDYLRF